MVVERIKEARYSFYNEQFDQVSQEAKDFISALLQKSPEFRMTAANALLHPWIKTLIQVGENSWPMARLDVSRLKTFNARRKWHVRNTVQVEWFIRSKPLLFLSTVHQREMNISRAVQHLSTLP